MHLTPRTASRKPQVTARELGDEPGRQVSLDRQTGVDRQPPLQVRPGVGELRIRNPARRACVVGKAGPQRLLRGERQHMRAPTGAPGAPAERCQTGERVGGNRQQEVDTSEDAEIGLLVVGAQRIAHRNLGVRNRLPLGHVHLSPRVRLSHLDAYNLQGQTAMTMGGSALLTELYPGTPGSRSRRAGTRAPIARRNDPTTDGSRVNHPDQYANGRPQPTRIGPMGKPERVSRVITGTVGSPPVRLPRSRPPTRAPRV